MRTPKEDPGDKRERKRQRRVALLENRQAAEQQSYGATRDIAATYGAMPATGVTPSTRKTPNAISMFSGQTQNTSNS